MRIPSILALCSTTISTATASANPHRSLLDDNDDCGPLHQVPVVPPTTTRTTSLEAPTPTPTACFPNLGAYPNRSISDDDDDSTCHFPAVPTTAAALEAPTPTPTPTPSAQSHDSGAHPHRLLSNDDDPRHHVPVVPTTPTLEVPTPLPTAYLRNLGAHPDHPLYHVPKIRQRDTFPYVVALFRTIQETPSHRPLLVLCDSGATTSWINNDALPPGTTPTIIETIKGITVAGEFLSNRQVTIRDLLLPELYQDKILSDLQARVFDAWSPYDIILGRDALRHLELVLDFKSKQITTTTSSVPMRSFPNDFTSTSDLATQLHLSFLHSSTVATPTPTTTRPKAPTPSPTAYDRQDKGFERVDGFDSPAYDEYLKCSSSPSELSNCEASYEATKAAKYVHEWIAKQQQKEQERPNEEGTCTNWWCTLLPDFAGNRGVGYLITTAVVVEYLHVLRGNRY